MEGNCADAIRLPQDHRLTPDVTRVLISMKDARRVEAVELVSGQKLCDQTA